MLNIKCCFSSENKLKQNGRSYTPDADRGLIPGLEDFKFPPDLCLVTVRVVVFVTFFVVNFFPLGGALLLEGGVSSLGDEALLLEGGVFLQSVGGESESESESQSFFE